MKRTNERTTSMLYNARNVGTSPFITTNTMIEELERECRENGHTELADTVVQLWDRTDLFDDKPLDIPIEGDTSISFRAGVVLGYEHAYRETENERPNARKTFVETVRNQGYRRVADAFEYCWERPEKLERPEFDHADIPLEPRKKAAFAVGISFGLMHVTKGSSRDT